MALVKGGAKPHCRNLASRVATAGHREERGGDCELKIGGYFDDVTGYGTLKMSKFRKTVQDTAKYTKISACIDQIWDKTTA